MKRGGLGLSSAYPDNSNNAWNVNNNGSLNWNNVGNDNNCARPDLISRRDLFLGCADCLGKGLSSVQLSKGALTLAVITANLAASASLAIAREAYPGGEVALYFYL